MDLQRASGGAVTVHPLRLIRKRLEGTHFVAQNAAEQDGFPAIEFGVNRPQDRSTMSRLLLILDDDRVRLRGFDEIAPRLGKDWVLRTWRDAPSMIAELDRLLGEARLISLDHDLYKDSPSDPDPGTGRMIANLLSKRQPVCPVIVHSTNTDAAWGMSNELASGGWNVKLVHHLNQLAWIEELWLPVATHLLAGDGHKNNG